MRSFSWTSNSFRLGISEGVGVNYYTNILMICLCLPQWDEVSILDDRGKLIRTFEVCNVNQNPRVQDNWLATPFLYRHAAPRVFVTLRFSVRDCASLRTPSPTCRETLTLFYKQADSQKELERTWMAEVRCNACYVVESLVALCVHSKADDLAAILIWRNISNSRWLPDRADVHGWRSCGRGHETIKKTMLTQLSDVATTIAQKG